MFDGVYNMSLTGKPALTLSASISNEGFWPDLFTADLLTKYRIPAEYANEVIETGMVLAMLRVNIALALVETAIRDTGFTTAVDYIAANPRPIGKTEWLNVQYEHAVYCRAKAFLLKQFATLNRKEIGENAAKESAQTEQYWLDESTNAIAEISALICPDTAVSSNHGVHVASL